jgi:hypothetical protein
MKGRFTVGTVSASIAQLPLPTNFGTITTASNIPSTSYASGLIFRETASANTLYSVIQSPSVAYVNFSGQLGNTTINPNNASTGSSLWSSGDTISVPEIAIPIQGWTNSPVIIGSFDKIEKCAENGECDDTFSARVSATSTITSESKDWINGNCSYSAGQHTCNFVSGTFTVAPICTATFVQTGTAGVVEIETITSSSIIINTRNPSFNPVQFGFTLSCQKTGVDYKPKTAKVATSIGVPTVPGITTQAIDTFSFSYGTTNATTVCSASPCS